MDSDDLAIDDLLGAAAMRERTRHVDPEFVRRVERRLAPPRRSPLRAGVLLAAMALACVLALPQLAGLWSFNLVSALQALAEPVLLARDGLPDSQGLWSGLSQGAQSLRGASSWLVGAAFMLVLVLVPLWISEG